MYITKKNKSALAKMIVVLMTMLTMALAMNCTMTASAAEISVVEVIADAEEVPSIITDVDFITMEVPIVNAAVMTPMSPNIYKLEGEVATGDADSTFQTVINFFVKWFRRVGAVVALVGGIMFALAIKDNNADQKQTGLMTMIAGFAVIAICTGVDMFDLFS